MRKRAVIFLTLALTGLSAQAAEIPQATQNIPFQIKESMMGGGSLAAPCEINGQAAECKIDFGANMSSVRLTPETAQFPSKSQMRYVSVTGRKVSCDLIDLPRFKLGSVEKNSYEMVRCPAVDSRTELNILGIDFFKNSKVLIDYKNKELQIDPKITLNKLEAFRFDAVGHVLIPISAGHRYQAQTPTFAMVDTGASLTLVDRGFVERFPQYFTLIKEYDQGKDTHGHTIKAKLMIMSGIIMQDHVAAGEYVMSIEMQEFKKLAGHDVDFILGHNVLKTAQWYFDFSTNQWSALAK